MIINNEQNMEYGILNIESKIQDSFFPNFSPTRYSTFDILHSAQRGFTLVETLIAIAILLIAVVGPISLIGDALHKLYYAKDQMIAINLAQEGIEVVRQRRDDAAPVAGWHPRPWARVAPWAAEEVEPYKLCGDRP